MLLLKGFFRKKSTKIYLLLLSTLLVAIITLFTFINYYKLKINEIFEDSSDIFIISNSDYYQPLIKSKNFSNLKKVLAFNPDYSSNILGRQCEKIIDAKTGIVIDNFDSCSHESVLNWDHFFFFAWKNNNIVVMPSSKLKDEEIIMGYYQPLEEHATNSKPLIGKEVSFYFDDHLLKFTIKGFQSFNFPRVLIATDIFEKLVKTNKLFAYIGTPKNYYQAHLIQQNLNDLENIEYARINTLYDEKANNDINIFHSVVDYLTIASYLMIIIFTITLITTMKNSLVDEKKVIIIERLLGYNLMQIRQILFLKILVLNIVVILISTIISVLINIIINITKINVVVFNVILLLKVDMILVLIGSIFSFTYGIGLKRKGWGNIFES